MHVPRRARAVCRAQYFWEAFPAGSGPTERTTYMFTYLDSAPYRPSMAAMMDDYWALLPQVGKRPAWGALQTGACLHAQAAWAGRSGAPNNVSHVTCGTLLRRCCGAPPLCKALCS